MLGLPINVPSIVILTLEVAFRDHISPKTGLEPIS